MPIKITHRNPSTPYQWIGSQHSPLALLINGVAYVTDEKAPAAQQYIERHQRHRDHEGDTADPSYVVEPVDEIPADWLAARQEYPRLRQVAG